MKGFRSAWWVARSPSRRCMALAARRAREDAMRDNVASTASQSWVGISVCRWTRRRPGPPCTPKALANASPTSGVVRGRSGRRCPTAARAERRPARQIPDSSRARPRRSPLGTRRTSYSRPRRCRRDALSRRRPGVAQLRILATPTSTRPRRRQPLHEFADVPGTPGPGSKASMPSAHAPTRRRWAARPSGQTPRARCQRGGASSRGSTVRPATAPEYGARSTPAARRRHRRAARPRRAPSSGASLAPVPVLRAGPSHAHRQGRTVAVTRFETRPQKVTSGVIWPQGSSRIDVNPEP